VKAYSRRGFLTLSAGFATALALRPRLAFAATPDVAFAPSNRFFDYSQVELLEGPMRQQFETNHAFFLRMDEDRLLRPFRQAAKMNAPGDPMGGWYDFDAAFDPKTHFDGFIPGHTFGQYLSGLARAYRVTGKVETREKVRRLVEGFAPTITKNFYRDYHLPAYTYDKTSIGLIDAHRYAGILPALDAHRAATEAALPWLPEKALSRPEQYARPHKDEAYCWDETYTLPENLFLAYRLTGDPYYRHLANRFVEDDSFFDPLARGENALPGEHAYSHLNALSSAVQTYLVEGNAKHLRAALNGFDFVQEQSFATGGWGPNETFRKPLSGEVGESLHSTHASFETPCGAYGHFKICRYLMSITGDSRFGDSMETILYNTVLGALPLREDGSSFYYSDYNHQASKFYHHDKWPCCSGTFPQITADYGISSYMQDEAGVYVVLYSPSKLSWRRENSALTLTQHTSYPYRPEVEIEIGAEKETRFALRLRIPAWAGAKSTLAINGRREKVELTPGRFFTLDRAWKNGDRVTLELDTPLSLSPVDAQHPHQVALMHGSLALFAIEPGETKIEKKNLLAAQQNATGSTDWSVGSATGKVQFRSFPAIGKENYRLYQEVEG
jgi:hypothetical protein